jgi:hypothetical protein
VLPFPVHRRRAQFAQCRIDSLAVVETDNVVGDVRLGVSPDEGISLAITNRRMGETRTFPRRWTEFRVNGFRLIPRHPFI